MHTTPNCENTTYTFLISSFKRRMLCLDSMIAEAPRIMYHGMNSQLTEQTIPSRDHFDFHELTVLILFHCLWHEVATHTARLLFCIGYRFLNYELGKVYPHQRLPCPLSVFSSVHIHAVSSLKFLKNPV